jgi:hypothetical protein
MVKLEDQFGNSTPAFAEYAMRKEHKGRSEEQIAARKRAFETLMGEPPPAEIERARRVLEEIPEFGL